MLTLIDLSYKELQDQLVDLVKAGARGTRNKPRPTVNLVKKRINNIMERVWCSQHTILLGCIDPTPGDDEVRAVSTIKALTTVADARLPALIPERFPDTPAAPDGDRTAFAQTGAQVSTAPGHGVPQAELLPGHVQLPVIDEEFRELLGEVARIAELRISEEISSLSGAGWSLSVSQHARGVSLSMLIS